MLEAEANGGGARAYAPPFGLRGMTPTSPSNRDPACDRSLDMAQQPIAIAGSKGLPVFKTPKHSTNSFRIAATTICLGLRRDLGTSTELLAPRLRDCTAWRIVPACIVQREERRCQSWRYVSLDRQSFPTDAAAGSIPHRQPPRRSSAVHPDQAIRPTRRQPKYHRRH